MSTPSTQTGCIIFDEFFLFLNFMVFLQQRLKSQYWFDCRCIPCEESWPLMHEMTDDILNFRCPACNGGMYFFFQS